MITEIEKAKSGNSHCVSCKKNIQKGEIRGIEETSFRTISSVRYYCLDCALQIIEFSLADLKSLRKEILKHVKS